MSVMSGMDESEGREDEIGDTDSGALPEGADFSQGDSADPARRDGLPLVPRSSKSAGTLDLAASSDEPTQLIRMLVMAAQEHIGESERELEWKVLLGYFHRAEQELQRMQAAPSQKHGRVGTL